jgi:WD40 repeat protein
MNVLSVLDAHKDGVTSVAFHANGTQAISSGADKTVKLWDLTKGQVLRTFGPLPEAVRAVAFNRTCTQIGAASGKTVTVWNVADGKEVRKLEHPAEVAGLSFSADSTRLATAAADNLARTWEVATGLELQAFHHTAAVRAVVYHPGNNGLLVSGSADKTVAVHQTTVARALSAGTPIRALTLTPNGTHVLTAGDDGKIKLWNTGNGTNERTIDAGAKAVHALAVSKNNVLLAAGGPDQNVRLFTLNDGKEVGHFKSPGVIRSLSFTPNNQMLAAACTTAEKDKGAAGVIQTWNVNYTPGQPVPAEFGKAVQTYKDAGAIADIVFAAAGNPFYSASTDKAIKVWKVAADTPVKNFGHPNLVDVVAFNPAGTQLATGCHDGRVRIFDVAKGNVVREIVAHVAMNVPSAVYCLAWSADGKQLISGSYDHSLKLWNVADGKMIREFKGFNEKTFPKGHREGVVSVALAPDGKTMASAGGWDHNIKIWNVADGTVLHELVNPKLKPGAAPESHPGTIYNLRYAKGGKYLVSVGETAPRKGFLAVWNAADGKQLFGEKMPLGPLFSLAVSPDSKLLAIGSGGTTPGGENLNNAYLMKLPVK